MLVDAAGKTEGGREEVEGTTDVESEGEGSELVKVVLAPPLPLALWSDILRMKLIWAFGFASARAKRPAVAETGNGC